MLVSLGVIVVAVGTSVVVSLVLTRGAEPDAAVLEAAGRGDLVKKPDEASQSEGTRDEDTPADEDTAASR